jgi:hypothetical protein
MSRNPKHVVVMSTILVLILAVVGVGFTAWQQLLVIHVPMNTDSLNVSWEDSNLMDPCEVDPMDPTVVNVTAQDDVVIGHHFSCGLRIRNDGALDVAIISEEVVQLVPPWTIADGSNYFPGAPAYTNGEIFIRFLNGVGTVIPAGGALAVELQVAVEDEAQQNTDYSFDFEVVVEQN